MVTYIVRRLVLAVLTVWAISVLSFMIIHLPPGDYVTSYIASMSASGSAVSEGEAQALREQLGLDKPITVQYAKWMGLILQGNFGMAMEWGRPVSDVIGDRLIADDGHLGGGDHLHLGHRVADRHLLRGLPLFVPGLRVHVRRLHRARHSRVPAGARRHVRRLRVLRRERGRPLLARFHRSAVELRRRSGTSPSTCRSRPSCSASRAPRSSSASCARTCSTNCASPT